VVDDRSQQRDPATRGNRLAWLIGALPVLGAAWLAWSTFCRLPRHDYWGALASSCIGSRDGGLPSLRTAWGPVVDQRMLTPRLIVDGLARLTSNDHYALEIALGFGAQLLALWIVAGMVRRTGLPPSAVPWTIAAAAFLLFWPFAFLRFQHHWLSTQYALSITPALFAVAALQRGWGTWSGLASAAVGSALAGLAHGTGLMLPIAAAVALGLAPGWSVSQRVTWAIGTLAGVTAVRWGISPRPGATGLPDAAHVVRYWTSAIVPGAGSAWPGAVLVAAVLGLLVAIPRRLLCRAQFPWTLILIWGFGVATATTCARAEMARFAPDRYAPLFVNVHIAAGVLVLVALDDRRLTSRPRARRVAFVAASLLAGAVAVGYVTAAFVGIRKARNAQRVADHGIACLRYAAVAQRYDFRGLHPLPRFEARLMPTVAATYGLPVIYDPRPFTEDRHVALDVRPIDGAIVVTPARPLEPDEVLLVDSAAIEGPITYSWDTDGHEGPPPSRTLPGIGGEEQLWLFFPSRVEAPVIRMRLNPPVGTRVDEQLLRRSRVRGRPARAH
jgi:hypothetical protein